MLFDIVIYSLYDLSELLSSGVMPSDALLSSPVMMSQHGFGGGNLGGAGGGQVVFFSYFIHRAFFAYF